MSKELVTPAKAEKFRDKIRLQLLDHEKEFWQRLGQLKPKDFCDIYIKMLPYGFAKVPEEHPLDEDSRNKLILEETTRKATIIGGGLPESTEDVDYEEE